MNRLHHFVFNHLSAFSQECHLEPTDDLEQFRCMFSVIDWQYMFGGDDIIIPSYGEVVFAVKASPKTDLIGFIRMLFAEENDDCVEFHVGFQLANFSNKRTAMIACLVILKLYLSIVGGTPRAKINNDKKAVLNWCKKLGFKPIKQHGDYIEVCHHGKIEIIEKTLKRYKNSSVSITSNQFVCLLQNMLILKNRFQPSPPMPPRRLAPPKSKLLSVTD